MATKPDEPMLEVLKAQQANIARIATDLVLPGTTGQGDNIKLWGPAQDAVFGAARRTASVCASMIGIVMGLVPPYP